MSSGYRSTRPLSEMDNKILDLWKNSTLTQDEIAEYLKIKRNNVHACVSRARNMGDERAIPSSVRSRNNSSLSSRRSAAAAGSRAQQSEYHRGRRAAATRSIRGQRFPSSKEELMRLAAETSVPVKRLPPGEAWGIRKFNVVDKMGW